MPLTIQAVRSHLVEHGYQRSDQVYVAEEKGAVKPGEKREKREEGQ